MSTKLEQMRAMGPPQIGRMAVRAGTPVKTVTKEELREMYPAPEPAKVDHAKAVLAEAEKRTRGRPKSPLTKAERQRLYRARQRRKERLAKGGPTHAR